MKNTTWAENKTRLCVTCKERVAYRSGSYCGKCSAKMSAANVAKREKKQQHLVVSLAQVNGFLEAIPRTVLELESAKSQETKRYLRTVIDRQVGNLGLLALSLIKAQIK